MGPGNFMLPRHVDAKAHRCSSIECLTKKEWSKKETLDASVAGRISGYDSA